MVEVLEGEGVLTILEGVCKKRESESALPKRNGLVAKRNVICGNDYFLASLIVDMKSFIRLFARINLKYDPY